jgi:hypothetical protein
MIHVITIALIYGFLEARRDHALIAAQIPIVHGPAFWLRRAVPFAVIIAAAHLLMGEARDIPASLIAGGAFFASMHRLTLNLLRGLPPWYMSNSNAYDRTFVWLLARYAAAGAYILELSIANAAPYINTYGQ